MVPAGIEFVLNHIYNKSCECCFHRAFTTFSPGNRKVGMQTIMLFDIMLCHVAAIGKKKLWREVELSFRAMQFSPLASVWSKLCSTGKFRGIPGVQALFNNKLWLLTCFVVIACCIPLNHVMPLIWIDWLWMIEVWNVVMAWNYARGNAIPGRGASAWNFGGFPSLAIRCVWSPKQKRFPEQFSALFAWWAFGGNHFKLIWPAPWWGLASLLWQQGVHKKGPKERRQTDQMVSRCYICLYMVQECSRFKRIRFTQRTFLGVSSLKVSMTSAGFLQIEQHYAAKPREKEEGEHIIHFSRQPGHAYFFDLTITYLKVACEVYGVPRLAALPNRFQRKQVPRIMLIAELQAQHVFPAGRFWIYDISIYIHISFPAGKPGDQTFVF